jgi:uncharacterized protein YciI
MYLLNLSFTKSPEQIQPENPAHGAWVKKYLADGTFLFAGAKKNGQGGIIAVKSIAESAINAILAEDSYVVADVVAIRSLTSTSSLRWRSTNLLKGFNW